MAAFVIIVAGLRTAQPLAAPFLLAMFLAIICTPPLEFLRSRRVPTPVALAIVLSAASLLFLTVVIVALASISDFVASAVRLQDELYIFRDELVEKIDQRDEDGDDNDVDDQDGAQGDDPGSVDDNNAGSDVDAADLQLAPANAADDAGPASDQAADRDADAEVADADDMSLRERIEEYSKQFIRKVIVPDRIVGYIVTLVSSLGGMLTNAFLVLVTLGMILLEASGFPAKMLALFHGEPTGLRHAEKIRNAVMHYISIKSWVSLLVGVSVAVWTQFLEVPYAVLWGILAFFFNFVPNIGSIIAAIPAVLIALLHFEAGDRMSQVLWTAGGYLVINCVVGYAIEPRLMGRGLGLSTLVVFISLVFWGWVLGPVGMLLSVPLTMIAKIVLEAAPETRWVAVLLSGNPTVAMASETIPDNPSQSA